MRGDDVEQKPAGPGGDFRIRVLRRRVQDRLRGRAEPAQVRRRPRADLDVVRAQPLDERGRIRLGQEAREEHHFYYGRPTTRMSGVAAYSAKRFATSAPRCRTTR